MSSNGYCFRCVVDFRERFLCESIDQLDKKEKFTVASRDLVIKLHDLLHDRLLLIQILVYLKHDCELASDADMLIVYTGYYLRHDTSWIIE